MWCRITIRSISTSKPHVHAALFGTKILSGKGHTAKMTTQSHHLAISRADDDESIRVKYRPYLQDPEVEANDWVAKLELDSTISMMQEHLGRTNDRLKVLMLYGSLRQR